MLAAMKFPRALILAFSMLLSVCAFTPTRTEAAADRVDLLVEALLGADTEMLERLLASNFVFIGSNGHIQDKEHFITTIRNKDLQVTSAKFENTRETSAGPVRLVTGNGTFVATSITPLPSGLMRVTLVADTSGPRERIVLVQLTPVIPTSDCKDGNCLIR